MAITDKAWDGSASRFPDAQSFCAACLIDSNPAGKEKVKANCSLPVKEPDGTINSNALSAAAAALAGARGGVQASAAEKKAAAKALLRYYAQAKMTPPDSLKRMAQ